MTRTVTDTALMMGVLSQPDARDHMSLPYQDIAWLDLDMDLRGVRIGLLLDAGCGLPVDPEILTPCRPPRACSRRPAPSSNP